MYLAWSVLPTLVNSFCVANMNEPFSKEKKIVPPFANKTGWVGNTDQDMYLKWKLEYWMNMYHIVESEIQRTLSEYISVSYFFMNM